MAELVTAWKCLKAFPDFPFLNDRVVRWAARSPSAPALLKREEAQAVVQRAEPLLAQPEAAAHGKPALEAAHGQPPQEAARE
jgi:hypothetical protein